jgi:hypothetical protein
MRQWGAARLAAEAEKVRRYGEFRYAAKSWNVERCVVARVEAGPQGADSRFIPASSSIRLPLNVVPWIGVPC